MNRYFIFVFIQLFILPVYAISSYQASYDLHAKTDLGYLKFGTAEYELQVAKDAYVFRSMAKTDALWSAVYDYSVNEVSIGLIQNKKLIGSFYKINELQGDSINNDYEVNIYPDELYVTLNNEIKWVIDPAEIADALSIYLKISQEIKLNPNKKFIIFNVVDKKGVKSRRFNIEGNEIININNVQVETIKVSCPEARLTFNVSKNHNYIPIMINKINGKTEFKLTLKDYKL